jgi:hypothetical protein
MPPLFQFRINSMHKFKFTIVDESPFQPIQACDAAEVLMSLRERPNWDPLRVLPDVQLGLDGYWKFPRLTVSWLEGSGYEVQYHESAESCSDLLVTSPELHGLEQTFVPHELAEKALTYFLRNGVENPALHWIGIGSFLKRSLGVGKVHPLAGNA